MYGGKMSETALKFRYGNAIQGECDEEGTP